MLRRRRLIRTVIGELFGGHVIHFQVEHDKVGMVPPGQFQPFFRTARRQGSHSAAFQHGLQHFASLFRPIDDQHTALPVQGYTLRGEFGRDILAPTEG